MSIQKKIISNDPSFLGLALSENEHAISQAHQSIATLAPKVGLRPRLFEKLHKWMEHLTFLRREETALVNKISAIEEAHQKNRNLRLLRRAKFDPSAPPNLDPEIAMPPRKKGWRYLMLAIMLMSSSRQKTRPTLRND